MTVIDLHHQTLRKQVGAANLDCHQNCNELLAEAVMMPRGSERFRQLEQLFFDQVQAEVTRFACWQ